MDEHARSRYADAVVRDALRIGAGQVVAVHSESAQGDFCVALAEAGYRAGARLVDLLYVEPRDRRARALHAPADALGSWPSWHDERMRELLEAGAGIVWVAGESEPGLMSDVPPERAARLAAENL